MYKRLRFCPACGQQRFGPQCEKSLQCDSCGFVLYMNPGTAAAAIIEYRGRVLFAVRANDPQAGKLDLPGGFVDYHETAEQALARELDEELSLRNVSIDYMASFPNSYPYAGVEYQTLDLIYTVKLEHLPDLQAADDVAAIRWIAVEEIPYGEIAFTSVSRAVRYYSESVFQRQ